MNNEIKEIREYISCPQFGDNHYGKWGALRLDQRIKIKALLDSITNLQQYYYDNVNKYEELIEKYYNLQKENEKLKERCDYLQRSCDRKEEQRDDAVMEYIQQEDYKQRIDKAIEKIEKYKKD